MQYLGVALKSASQRQCNISPGWSYWGGKNQLLEGMKSWGWHSWLESRPEKQKIASPCYHPVARNSDNPKNIMTDGGGERKCEWKQVENERRSACAERRKPRESKGERWQNMNDILTARRVSKKQLKKNPLVAFIYSFPFFKFWASYTICPHRTLTCS